jgi:glycine/D-amino acid oxidase-like deaminating enzyme
MQRIAIIGAGIVGAATAFRLAQQGAQVYSIERALPGRGTTATSFARVSAVYDKPPQPYFNLKYAGLQEYLRVREEFGMAPWLHACGSLVWSDSPAAPDDLHQLEHFRTLGYAIEWWQAARVMRELEADIAFPSPQTPVAFFPQEAWIDAPLLTAELLTQARRHGAEVRYQTSVEAIEIRHGQVNAVRLATGERLAVDAVVNAAGPNADQSAALVGLPLPLTPTRGLLVELAVDRLPLRRIIQGPDIRMRPASMHRVLIQASVVDKQLAMRTAIQWDDPLCGALVQRAQQVIPALATASLAQARIGVRPIPLDGLPCVGGVSAVAGYYEAVTDSGVTLGPLVGRLLAQEILTGRAAALLAPFRPDRFARSPCDLEHRPVHV